MPHQRGFTEPRHGGVISVGVPIDNPAEAGLKTSELQCEDQSSDCAAGSPGAAPTEAASSVTSTPEFKTIAAPDDAD
jgi:hypothetical protein